MSETNHTFSVSYDEYYKNALDNAGKKKQQAIDKATTELNKANINAEAQYRQAQTGYGSKAEKLAAMGLTSSGYSDYLSGKAYEQLNASKIAAQNEYNVANREAENQYDTQKESLYKGYAEEQKNIGNSLLEMAYSGEYTDDFLKAYAKNNGYSGSMADDDELWKQVLATNKEARTEYYSGQRSGYESTVKNEQGDLNYTISDFNSAVDQNILTREDADKLISINDKTAVLDYINALKDNSGLGVAKSKEVAYRKALELNNTDRISGDAWEIIEKLHDNSDNRIVSSGISFNNNPVRGITGDMGDGQFWNRVGAAAGDILRNTGIKVSGNPMAKNDKYAAGDNFSVKYTTDDGKTKKIRIESAGVVNSSKFEGVTPPTTPGAVFGYKGDIYMVRVDDGKTSYVKIQGRGGRETNEYKTLWSLVYGDANNYGGYEGLSAKK